MPCYCDTPSDEDQKEIERRAKVKMYFEATNSISADQAKETTEKDIKLTPGHEIEEINEALCKICSILTKAQMENISAYYYQIKWPHKNLYDWYVQHLKDDGALRNHQNAHYIPENEEEYNKLVSVLDTLLDIVGDHESHRLISLVDDISHMIACYEEIHYKEV